MVSVHKIKKDSFMLNNLVDSLRKPSTPFFRFQRIINKQEKVIYYSQNNINVPSLF